MLLLKESQHRSLKGQSRTVIAVSSDSCFVSPVLLDGRCFKKLRTDFDTFVGREKIVQ